MMKNKLFYLPVLAIFAFLMVACSSEKKNDTELREDDNGISVNVNEDGEKANININEDGINIDIENEDGTVKIKADNLQDALKQLNDGKDVIVIDHRDLKELFPKSIGSFDLVSSESQKTGFGDIKTSVANAEYEDGNSTLELTIVDSGGFGLAINALAGWTNIEMDKETSTGYERTTTIDGYKGFESYDTASEDGSIAVIIKDRVLYSAEITNGSERQLKRGHKAVDIDDIEKMIKRTEK
ncbi:MAG: hypothetical protein DWQ02_11020 [Bacteroidetes bacterium]|nr:MAG: hypothetical protein DWQ02_11020 [Bacteroidota bacterium]